MSKISVFFPIDRTPHIYISILIALYLILSISLLHQTEGIPFFGQENRERVAEHYSAYQHGYNAWRYGWSQSYGLADESTSSNIDSHPVVYIHGNILSPRLFTFLLLQGGIESIYSQTLIFILISSIWIPLAYLSFARLFDSYIAFLGTFLIATDYSSTLVSSFNLFRGWHTIIFFFLLWASARLNLKERKLGQYAAFTAAIFLAVNYELPFAAFCLLIAGFVIYLNHRSIKKAIIVVLAPTVLFLGIYAVQVAFYLGGISRLIKYAYTTFTYRTGLLAVSNGSVFNQYATQNIIFWDTSANPWHTTRTFIFDAAVIFGQEYGLWFISLISILILFLLLWMAYTKLYDTNLGRNFVNAIDRVPPVHLILLELFILFLTSVFVFVLVANGLISSQLLVWLLISLGSKLLVYAVVGFYKPERFLASPEFQLRQLVFFGLAMLFFITHLFYMAQQIGWISLTNAPFFALVDGLLLLLLFAILHSRRIIFQPLVPPNLAQGRSVLFVLFAFVATLITASIFPANLDFYNRNLYPLFVFFVYLAVPAFLSYIHIHQNISSVILTSIFLVFWFSVQIQAYNATPPAPDELVQILQDEYSGTSFATTIPFTYQPIWYAVKSDVSLIDINLSPDRPADAPIFAYNRNFAYNNTGRPPQNVYLTREEVLDVSAYLLLNQDVLHTFFKGKPEIVDLERGKYAIITIDSPTKD